MSPEFNFVHSSISDADKELFFGPLEESDGPFIVIEENWIMAHVLHAAGVFPSVSQAKKNGWDRPIDPGFTDITVTKRKIRICILKEFD